jgi:hypothetical protein
VKNAEKMMILNMSKKKENLIITDLLKKNGFFLKFMIVFTWQNRLFSSSKLIVFQLY